MMGGMPVYEDISSEMQAAARQPIPSFAKMFLFGSQVSGFRQSLDQQRKQTQTLRTVQRTSSYYTNN